MIVGNRVIVVPVICTDRVLTWALGVVLDMVRTMEQDDDTEISAIKFLEGFHSGLQAREPSNG